MLYSTMLLFYLPSQPKKESPLIAYPPFLLHSPLYACSIVVKLLSVCHILGKFINATSYFKILSTFFLYIHPLSLAILIWSLTLFPFQKKNHCLQWQKSRKLALNYVSFPQVALSTW
jgi:hypothetical protein